jgi:hypothetical protein
MWNCYTLPPWRFYVSPVIKERYSPGLRVRLPIQHPTVVRMTPWVRSLIHFSSSSRLLALRPESHIERHGEVLDIRSLEPGSLSQHMIVNGPNERLLISAHIHKCSSLQNEEPQVWQFSFRSPTKHPSHFFENVILIILCQLIFRIVLLKAAILILVISSL